MPPLPIPGRIVHSSFDVEEFLNVAQRYYRVEVGSSARVPFTQGERDVALAPSCSFIFSSKAY
jgi:hypothetical protein